MHRSVHFVSAGGNLEVEVVLGQECNEAEKGKLARSFENDSILHTEGIVFA